MPDGFLEPIYHAPKDGEEDVKPIEMTDGVWRNWPKVSDRFNEYFFGKPKKMNILQRIKWMLLGCPKTEKYWEPGEFGRKSKSDDETHWREYKE